MPHIGDPGVVLSGCPPSLGAEEFGRLSVASVLVSPHPQIQEGKQENAEVVISPTSLQSLSLIVLIN